MQQRIIDLRSDPAIARRLSSDENGLDTTNKDSCISFCHLHEPKLSIMLTLNQGQLEELLEWLSVHLIRVIASNEFHLQITAYHWITKWMYATLACLRSPLDPEVHNRLRVIAKSCLKVVTHLKSSAEESSSDTFLPWNLIIVVIAINFHQFDLLSL